ncbi:MAG: ferritin family protein [Candidatus Omnitrophota bacterium]
MGNIFSGSEVIELGIEIEKNGRDFYNALATKSKSEDSRATFLKLATEEEKHLEAFNGMLERAGSSDMVESYSDEYSGYMRALASESIFTRKDKGRQIAAGVKTEAEAIELGIGFEKDSILFYEGMKKAVPEYDHKVIDELIAQEQSHLRLLRGLKMGK